MTPAVGEKKRTWRCACGARYVDAVERCPACGDTQATAGTPKLLAIVPSKSRPWVFHTIALDRHGKAQCSCEAGTRGKPCRHVRDLSLALASAILGEKKGA